MLVFIARIKSVLLYYSVVLATFLFVSGIYFAPLVKGGVVGVTLFTPILAFLWVKLIDKYRRARRVNGDMTADWLKGIIGRVLFFYSLIMTTIIFCLNYFSARSLSAVWSNIIFLPMVVFFWLVFYTRRQGEGH